jgi:hypothetical protein
LIWKLVTSSRMHAKPPLILRAYLGWDLVCWDKIWVLCYLPSIVCDSVLVMGAEWAGRSPPAEKFVLVCVAAVGYDDEGVSAVCLSMHQVRSER